MSETPEEETPTPAVPDPTPPEETPSPEAPTHVAPVVAAAPEPVVPVPTPAKPIMGLLDNLWAKGKDLLVIAVIPLVGWGVALEVGNAERDLHILRLQEDVASYGEELKEVKGMVHDNSIKLARMEGKIDTANGRLDDIKDLLSKPDR